MGQLQPMVILVLVTFLLLFIQGLFGVLQYRFVIKKYKEVRARNSLISVGRAKKFGRACIAILAFTQDGFLKEGYVLKGMTVFAGFKPIKAESGLFYQAMEESLKIQKPGVERDAVLQALDFLKKGLENKVAGQEGEESSDEEQIENC